MNSYIIQRLILRAAFLLGAAALSGACTDDDADSMLHFDKPEVVIGPEASTASFILRSNTSWTLRSDAEWFSLNLTQGAKSASVIVTYTDNPSTTEKRTAVITATTSSGDATDSFILSQMPVGSHIRPETDALPISATAAHHRIAVETSVNEGIELSVSYGDEEDGAWIENLALSKGILSFDARENTSSQRRVALIAMLHQDEFGRTTEASVRITQSFSMNPSAATERDFAFAAALAAGDVQENFYVTGQIVLDGKNANFPSGRYSIQDAEGRALLFESTIDLGLARNDRVRLWLLGSTVRENSEGTFTYKVFTGIAAEHIMRKESGPAVAPREVHIRDLTDEMLFSLVKLRDVEIAVPYGGLVNYDEYYVSGAGAAIYGDKLAKYYGTCIRDIHGDHLYMLTDFGVAYRRRSLPMGSGSITGLLTREYNANFGEMGTFQIRHLTEQEIALDPSRENSFSEVLAEWTCLKPAGFTEGITHVAPTTGPAAASLYKSNADGFYNAFLAGSGRIYFGNKPRGDVDSNGKGTANTVKSGAMYSALWDTNTYWLISNISTAGIHTQLSLQIETNSLLATGPRDFAVEYSTDGTAWTAVPGGNYTVIGQCDSKNTLPHYMPGFKVFDFALPAALQNQASVAIRLRCTSLTGVDGRSSVVPNATNRLAHVSIKYNR